MISIVIPCFNASETLPETLASLSGQTGGDWEAICIDDGSTDGTIDTIAAAAEKDARIRLARNPGKGPSAARNYASLCLAKGSVIAFCDADDLWAPEKTARLTKTFTESGADACFGRVAFFDADPEKPSTISSAHRTELSIQDLLGENPVCTMSNLAVTRDAFAATGGFDETLVHNEDLEWLIRLAGDGFRIVPLDDVLVYYRKSPFGLSADLNRMAAGRNVAVQTAQNYGFLPTPENEAVHLRYLARRALRLDQDRLAALKFALAGFKKSPRGFALPIRRGVPTLLGAIAAPLLTRPLRQRLFAR